MSEYGKIWSCKVGRSPNVPDGGDAPMREAVKAAYRQLTGDDPQFLFSGWGATLNKWEREAIERQDGPSSSVEATTNPPCDHNFHRHIATQLGMPVRCGTCRTVVVPHPLRVGKSVIDDKSDLPGMLAVAKGVAEQAWPHTTDARVWAQEWLKTPNHMGQADDEGAMISWFANAIMAGWDTCGAQHEEERKQHSKLFDDLQEARKLLAEAASELPHASGSIAERIAAYRLSYSEQITSREGEIADLGAKWLHALDRAVRAEQVIRWLQNGCEVHRQLMPEEIRVAYDLARKGGR